MADACKYKEEIQFIYLADIEQLIMSSAEPNEHLCAQFPNFLGELRALNPLGTG